MSPRVNLIFLLLIKYKLASSVIFSLFVLYKLKSSLKSKHWGVCVSKTFSRFKLFILNLVLYFTEFSDFIYGTTALLFFSSFFNFFNNLTDKFGLAAS